MTVFEELCFHGYELFKIRKDKKIPLHSGWQTCAALTSGEAMAENRVGLRLTNVDLVIDVDPRNGGTLESLGPWVLEYPIVDTAGGGWHIYTKVAADHPKFRHTLKQLPGIEFKTLGRFIVAPGSPGYEWSLATPGLPAPPAPPHIIAMIARADLAAGADHASWTCGDLAAALDQLDPVNFREHDEWLRLMMACHEATGGLGLAEFVKWSTSDEKYADHGLMIKSRWRSATPGREGNAGVGTLIHLLGGEAPASVRTRQASMDFDDAPMGDVTRIPVAPETGMQKMSRWYRAVDEDGKLRVYARRRDDTLNRAYWVRYTRRDFLEVCKSVQHLPSMQCGFKPNGKDPKFEEMGVHWLDHYHEKETYLGMTFAPEHDGEKTPDGKLNLWRGFAVNERAGSWELLKEQVLNGLCGSDTQSNEYVLDWLARAVQRPWEPGEVALVFRGKRGTGKSTLGRAFTRLFGQHGMHVASQQLLTGRFNMHLRDVVALFADEAFWAGDKQGEGVLKALVTERSLAYEGKGINAEMGRNCIHLVMASNEEWVVPAAISGERRFAVFEVSEDTKSKSYWDALHSELDNGGLEAMLWELRRRDVSAFNPHKIPGTKALAEQKLRSMGVVASWLYDQALDGWDDFGSANGNRFACDEVHNSYLRYCDRLGERGKRASKIMLGIALRRYMPDIDRKRVLMPGSVRQTPMYELPKAELVVRHIENMIGISSDRR